MNYEADYKRLRLLSKENFYEQATERAIPSKVYSTHKDCIANKAKHVDQSFCELEREMRGMVPDFVQLDQKFLVAADMPHLAWTLAVLF